MKAILVINMPEKCLECNLAHNGDFYCVATGSSCASNKRCKDCPLKPMPQKRTLPNWLTIGMPKGNEPWFTEGYNKCIDEILGEENETSRTKV